MKTTLINWLLTGFCFTAMLSCAQGIAVEEIPEEALQTITATVKLPVNTASKVAYSEVDPDMAHGLESVWEEGDRIEAMTNTGQRVTFVLSEFVNDERTIANFLAETSGITAETTWKALLGKRVADAGKAINCTYDGQDGTVGNLGDYDFITSAGSGITPVFDFAETGDRLTYFLRIKLPAGIRFIEYNADAYWAITGSGSSDKYYNNFDQVTEIDLGHASAAGEAIYVAVSATAHHNYINENAKGVIFTFFNEARNKSYGKVLSTSFTNKGGKIGTLDITSMTLIDRVLPENALDFGSVGVTMEKDDVVNSYNNLNDYKHTTAISTKWSPYNLCANWTSPANRGDYVGGCFSWGETVPKTEFTESGYGYKGDKTVGGFENFASTQLGALYTYQVIGPSGSGTMKLQHIAGTKYDAARVLWGSDWRMPTIEDLMMFTGSSTTKEYGASGTETSTETGFATKNENINVEGGLTMEGRWFSKNDVTIFFPSAGWNKKATWDGTQYFYARGMYWSDTRIRATPSNANLTNQALNMEFQRGGTIYYGKDPSGLSKDQYRGLYIRPVINNKDFTDATSTSPNVDEDNGVDEPVLISSNDLYGFIKDTEDNPVQGVVVSDGYTCCVTDRFGMYQMKANAEARTVSVTVPSDYKIPTDNNGHAAFYQLLGSKVDGKWEKNFQLEAYDDVPSRATIVAVADAHVKDATTLSKLQSALNDVNSTISTLKSTGIPVGSPANAPAGEVICIALGDQMWDNMSMASSVKAAYDGLSAPVFYAIGNHDNDNSKASNYGCENVFVQNFCPTNYSFDIANLHVVVMDDIYYTGNGDNTISFKEGFTQAQVDWLKADIAKVSGASDKIGVLCVHAPLSNASAGDSGTQSAVMSAFKNNFKNVHVISGHTHNINNNLYHGWAARSGRSIYEHTLQSISGYWWEADVAYVSGSPAGYGVFTFDANDIYAEYNKVTKQAPTFQMRVYDGGETYNKNSAWDEMMHGGARGYKEYTWSSPVKNKYVVRINDAGSDNDTEDSWSVSVNGSAMTRVSEPIQDACVASYVFNKIKGTHGDANGTTDQFWYSGSSFNSSFTVTATHTMKSGWSATYTSTHYVDGNYKGFAYGVAYD